MLEKTFDQILFIMTMAIVIVIITMILLLSIEKTYKINCLELNLGKEICDKILKEKS